MEIYIARRVLKLSAQENRFAAHREHPVRAHNLARMLLAANCEMLAASRGDGFAMGEIGAYSDRS